MKTLLLIMAYIFISSGLFADGLNLDTGKKPAPKSESKRISKATLKNKKEHTANLEEYKMDNGEYYIPKRKPKINYHYNKAKNSKKKR